LHSELLLLDVLRLPGTGGCKCYHVRTVLSSRHFPDAEITETSAMEEILKLLLPSCVFAKSRD